jgi:hypothetical protein
MHRRTAFPARLACAAALALALPAPADAQKAPREFTRQGLLIPVFTLAPGVEVRAADRAADEARKAARKAVDGKEVDVIDAHRIDSTLVRAGYTASSKLAESEIHILGTAVRADEYILGHVERSDRQGGPARVSGTLVLMRDQRLRQPLPTVTAPRLDDAAAELGRAAAAARVQFVHERRCENALRDGSARRAAEAARAGIAAYPRAVVARVCLVWALKGGGSSPAEVLAVAREIIEIDTANAHGLEAAAVALDSLRRPAESGPLWVRLARVDTADLAVTERALYALGDGGTAHAESLVVAVTRARPDFLPFVRHQWRIGFDRRNWPLAIQAAEVLMRRDSTATADSLFFRRLGLAYRSAGRPLESVATLARGVARFPGDARLYALYAQFVREEADTVLPRGLAHFPKHGELLALQARDLRGRGKVAEAADAMRLAAWRRRSSTSAGPTARSPRCGGRSPPGETRRASRSSPSRAATPSTAPRTAPSAPRTSRSASASSRSRTRYARRRSRASCSASRRSAWRRRASPRRRRTRTARRDARSRGKRRRCCRWRARRSRPCGRSPRRRWSSRSATWPSSSRTR